MRLFPSVGMKKQPTVHLVANFGQQPFIFDIDGMVKVCYLSKLLLKQANSSRKKNCPFIPTSVVLVPRTCIPR